MSKPLHALLIEDVPDDAVLLLKELQRGDYAVTHERVETAAGLEAALGRTPWDIVFSDYTLPNFGGDMALKIVKESSLDLPFIFVSGTMGEDVAVEAMKQGANDYVMKSNLKRLLPAIERELGEAASRRVRKQAEAAFRESELRYRTLFEQSPDAVVVMDPVTTLPLDFNDEACRRLGYSRAEFARLRIADYEADQTPGEIEASVAKCLAAGTAAFEVRHRTKTGGLRNVWVSVRTLETGGRKLFYAIWRDITERKHTEEAMRESEHKYRHLFESLGDSAFLVDLATGRIIDTNKQAEVLLGLSRGGIIGLRFGSTEQMSPLGKVLEQFLTSDQAGMLTSYDVEIPRPDATAAPVHVGLTPITLYGRKLVLVLVRDVTERRQLEEQFRQAQKMEAIGQLAGGVAHDFNNLLAVIRGSAEIVLMDAIELNLEARESLKQVIAASERAANLTRQLLAFGRKQVLHSQPLSLNDVISHLTKMLSRIIGEDIHLQCNYAPELPCVQADVGMMEQVLLNLVVNARDAMPGGGHLVLSTEKFSVDAAYARSRPEARAGEFALLSVSDTGTGIAPEHLPHIFEPFYTTKEVGKGTGLGLATVHGIVKQHQGWLEVETRPGTGTTFKMFLPAVAISSAELASEQSVLPPRGGTERILLIEDDQALRLVTRRVLESAGYRVMEASSGAKAMQIWPDRAAEIDLLLTDIVMPEGVTGLELAEQLRERSPELKVVFMSGYSAEVTGRDTDFVRRTKCYFLQKPFATNVLLQTVRQRLDEE